MTAGVDLERRLTAWFEDQAPPQAPDRLLTASLEAVAVTGQRRSLGRRIGWAWQGLGRRQRQAILVAATLFLLVGALVAGALLLQRTDPGGSANLLLVTPGAASPGDGGLTVHLRAPDGTTRVLATFDTAFLEGQYADGAGIAVSPGGYLAIPVSEATGGSGYRIVDLRQPMQPPRVPDAEAMFGAWGPDDRFVMPTNSGDLVVYDARTGTSAIVGTGGVGHRDILFHPVWTLDGSGLQSNGGDGQAGAGTIGLDGTVTDGATPAFDTGLGPRRTDAAGGRVQCVIMEDYGCEDGYTVFVQDGAGVRDLYVDDDPTTRIADFSVAADGGLWLLLQTVADGPRTVTLRHLAPDGTATDHGIFDGAADDPDESSFFEAATFAGFASDDSRILIRLAGEGGSFGQSWQVEPESGDRTRLDGTPAGWLKADALTAARPAILMPAEVPSTLRGAWVGDLPARAAAPSGSPRLQLKRSTGTLDGTDALSVRAEDPDRLVLRFARSQGDCEAGLEGVYRWSLAADRLSLEPIDEPCAGRAARLTGAFEPEMPTPDTGGARVPAGRTVLAAGFDVPFRITALADRDLGVSSYSERRVSVGVVDGAAEITILSVVGGALEPCERHGAQTALGPGIEGVLAFLARREEDGVVATPAEDVSIDGLTGPSVTVDLAGATDCAGFIHLFHDGRSSTGVPAGSRITLIEPVPDRVVAIVIPPETLADPASFEPVLDSIDFLEAGS